MLEENPNRKKSNKWKFNDRKACKITKKNMQEQCGTVDTKNSGDFLIMVNKLKNIGDETKLFTVKMTVDRKHANIPGYIVLVDNKKIAGDTFTKTPKGFVHGHSRNVFNKAIDLLKLKGLLDDNNF